jgi:predicted aspartyl protease
MGAFYTQGKVENITDREKSAAIPKLLADAGSDYTWIPAATLAKLDIGKEKDVPFVRPDGQQITRSIGFAIIRVDEIFTVDEVVFAEKGDKTVLGSRTLAALNLAVDSMRKQLVAVAGPYLAAASTDRKPTG